MTQAESFKKEDDIEISSISIIERMSADTQVPLPGTSQDESSLLLTTSKNFQPAGGLTSSSKPRLLAVPGASRKR